MIYSVEPKQAEIAKAYFEANVVTDGRFALTAYGFIRDVSCGILSSRRFDCIDHLYCGVGQGEFVEDLLSVLHTIQGGSKELNIFILDNGFSVSDITASEESDYESIYFPELVQSVRTKNNYAVKNCVTSAVRRCLSFVPLVAITEESNEQNFGTLLATDVLAVIVSAFDQEGVLGWCQSVTNLGALE